MRRRKICARVLRLRSSEKVLALGTSNSGLHDFQYPMVIAMISMRMVQMPVHQIVHMVSMRNSLVTAIGSMHMAGGMTADVVVAGATIRMLLVNFYHVLTYCTAFLVFKMAALQIICMSMVLDRCVAATWTMLMTFGCFHIQIGCCFCW